MLVSIFYSAIAIFIMLLVEGGVFDFPGPIRLIAFILYFPFIYMVFRIIINVLSQAIFPMIDAVESYFDKKYSGEDE